MNILINGKKADITLENEQTVGEVLAEIEQWIASTGNRLSGLSLDGKAIGAAAMEEAFSRPLEGVAEIDIRISTWVDLAAEALGALCRACGEWENGGAAERDAAADAWSKSAAAGFLSNEMGDMAELAAKAFSGKGALPSTVKRAAEERAREIIAPAGEIAALAETVSEVARRLGELPLDMQTGKDAAAAETMQLFTTTAEKLFRLLSSLKSHGVSMESFAVENVPMKQFIDGFLQTITELQDAYENTDTVLIGDLAEYELAPRLLRFYDALKNADN